MRKSLTYLILALFMLIAPPVAMIADWTPLPDTTKVLIRKKLSVPRDVGSVVPVPESLLSARGARIVDQQPTYLVVQVPSGNSELLKSDLTSIADSVETRPDFDVLDFLGAPIDARLPASAYPAPWARGISQPPESRDCFLIQFAAPPRPEWIRRLVTAGVTVVDYIPQNGYVVLGSLSSLRDIARAVPVQLIRIHQPFHKVAEPVRTLAEPFADVSISIAEVPEATAPKSLLQANTLRAIIPAQPAGDRMIYTVTIAADAIPSLAAFPAVIAIEAYTPPTPSGQREAHLIAGDTLVSLAGGVLRPAPGDYRSWIESKGLANFAAIPIPPTDYRVATRIALLDTGFDRGSTTDVHIDFLDRNNACFVTPINYTNDSAGNGDCYGHGTMVAGVLGGNAGAPFSTSARDAGSLYGDSDYYMGLGVVPEMPLVSGRIFSPALTFDPQPFVTIYSDLVLNRGVAITTNSWNNAADTTYNLQAQLLDRIVRSATGANGGPPMAIYFSAGNKEAPVQQPKVSAPATAKNVTTVGGSENFNPNQYPDPVFDPPATKGFFSDNGNEWWQRSAIGWTTADARNKPDLLAPASAIEGPRSRQQGCAFPERVGAVINDPGGPDSHGHYWSRGTSFAAPGAAGQAGLLFTWFRNRTGTAPSPSLLKAMQINLAHDMVSLGEPWDKKQGWGKVDLTRAFYGDGRYDWSNESPFRLLTPSSPTTYFPAPVGFYQIKDITRPVRVTLVWTDRFAASLTGAALVNDINLKVVATGSGRFFVGNWFDSGTRRSKILPGGYLVDHKNNVEHVVFTYGDALSDHFYVEVTAETLAGDALNVWSSPTELRQDFAIFIDNVIGQ